MLVALKKLNIVNEGYGNITFSSNTIYVNPSHIISVQDYQMSKDLLLREGANDYLNKSFSLVKVSSVNSVEEVIVVGSSGEIFSKMHSNSSKGILNG